MGKSSVSTTNLAPDTQEPADGHQFIPSLASLLAPLQPAFRAEVFPAFQVMTLGWVRCLGRRTISHIWETSGRAQKQRHAPAFRLFSQARWNWDELRRILLVLFIATSILGSQVWLVIADTLCHKRGAKVAFGGIFLDAVLSTKKHKTFRYGNNWVLLVGRTVAGTKPALVLLTLIVACA